MKEYTVIWHTGPVDAKTHNDAAERALKMMRDPQSSINDMFTVIEHNGSTKHIDLTQSRTGPRNKS